ncbi:energy-coupling factor ABC transporter ATP-binding protein [Dongia sp.]|uniref:energy-coupling factor ABC transporter ATP-binding protein n=1 Tax=Dongia sp. TaxID=1977262 RepID=UPI0035B061F2
MLGASNIDYTYPGGISALRNASLAIEAGEKLAILGPNGAGKSTLLQVLNGTLRPDKGTVRLHGTEMRHDKATLKAWRQAVGLVLQDPDDQLFAATVFEDVSFGPLNLGLGETEARTRVDEALATMDLADLADRPTHMLSFGQRKRVVLAGIVAMRPRILLLDEPSAGLDPLGVTHLMSALERIAAAGTTIVLTTHDVDLAYAWASRIALFGDRHVVATGAPDIIFADDAMIETLHLRRPIVWEMARHLRDRGLIDPALPAPRSQSELIAQLDGGQTVLHRATS